MVAPGRSAPPFPPATAISSRRKFNMHRDRTDSIHPLFLIPKQPCLCTLLVGVLSTCATTVALAQTSLEATFQQSVQPFLQRYCNDCHSGKMPEAKLDTSIFQDLSSVSSTWGTWQEMVSRVHEVEMPPADASLHPSDSERAMLKNWTRDFRRSEAIRIFYQ